MGSLRNAPAMCHLDTLSAPVIILGRQKRPLYPEDICASV